MVAVVITERIFILCAAFLLDFLLGDPHFLWHPVRGMGRIISGMEGLLRKGMKLSADRESDKEKKTAAGVILVLVTLLLSTGIPAALLYAARLVHPYLCIALECVMCYQLLAMKSLKVESMKVYDAFNAAGITEARKAVSMIVGRDTERLSEEGIIKAAVETVAENTSDGVIAPLFFMLVFGTPGGFFYKAVNTMDSMVGYKNDNYLYFGRAAAKLDDAVNFIPARIAAVNMILAAFFLGYNGENAVSAYKRYRHCHASPNSAQTESVCAGALGVQLAGDAWYFGQLHKKAFIGDKLREAEWDDIKRANRLLYGTSLLTLFIGISVLCLIRSFAVI